MAHTFRDGVHVALPPDAYQLKMATGQGANVIAQSPSFDALLEMRKQLARCGYEMVSLVRLPEPE